MRHTTKITLILILMFFIAQSIGIFVAHSYTPNKIQSINNETGELENKTVYNIPYGLEPPAEINPQSSVTSILIALAIAVLLMLTLMKLKAEIFLRIWFLLVVTLGLGLTLNAAIRYLPLQKTALIAIIIAIPLAIIKIFQRNLIVHNITELLIYPGIATVFIPLLNIPVTIFLLLAISVYDIYAVWHAGFMQKMAKYQMEKVKVFSGFFVPYIRKEDRLAIKKAKQSKKKSNKKIGVNVAILGGGDVVFPIILAGVVLAAFGSIWASFIISIGATAALATLFYYSKKGKYYPAMPFITTGCLIALGVVYLLF